MSVRVKDILGLATLKDAKVVCGEAGLKREVTRVNFTDSPLDEEDPGYRLVAQGDLYIHSFYENPKERSTQIQQLIEFYVKSGSSCCIGVEFHEVTFSKEVIDFANANDYPIILIANDVPFGKLIQEISELILTEQIDSHCEDKINRILFENPSVREQNELLQFLVPHLPENFICVNIVYPQLSSLRFKSLKNDLWSKLKLNFFKHRKGGFLILNYDIYNLEIHNMTSLLSILEHYGEGFRIGVSSKGSKNFVQRIKEAHYSCKIGEITAEKISYYDDVSIYMILLSVQNTQLMQIFVEKILAPLREYSNRHGMDMIETIKIYIGTDGDYKKAAALLHTHINTVRFRIQKAQSLLGYEENHFFFMEQVSMALKMETLIKNFNLHKETE